MSDVILTVDEASETLAILAYLVIENEMFIDDDEIGSAISIARRIGEQLPETQQEWVRGELKRMEEMRETLNALDEEPSE